MDNKVNEGDHVVLMKSFDSGNMKIVDANKNNEIHYGKLHFNVDPLIGAEYGSVFRIEGRNMIRVENFEEYDNKLSEDVSGNLITFHEKTQFSKEKILKKKKKKSHSNVVTLMKTNLTLINEMLFARDKIIGLRADVLSQVITLANLQCGSKCLVLDHNLGMITSAIMSRIIPGGVCIQLLPDYEALQTTRKTMQMLNVCESSRDLGLKSITIRDLYKIIKGIDDFNYEGNILNQRNKIHLKRLDELRNDRDTKKQKLDLTDEDARQIQNNLLKKEVNRDLRQRERVDAAHHLKSRSIDSVIIVVQNDHPVKLLEMMLHFLSPSRQFVIYSDTVEPLLDCYQYLKKNSLAIGLSISDSWFRSYQVLPDRTRPEMNTTGYGGYLLNGTKVLLASSKNTDEYDQYRRTSLRGASSG